MFLCRINNKEQILKPKMMEGKTKKLGKLIESAKVRDILGGLSQEHFYKWIRSGKLPYYRLGRKYLFDQDEIEKLIRESRVDVFPEPEELELEIQGMVERYNHKKATP